MKIRIGYELIYECSQAIPMILMLNVHYSRVPDLIIPDYLVTDPPRPIRAYRDSFGNWCSRVIAPIDSMRLLADALIHGSAMPDVVAPQATETPVESLPEEALLFLLASRYCETDRLSTIAWELFGHARAAGVGSRQSATSCTIA